jgi:gamma-butyrobetaine dioxygenase|tara:strand:+ start:110 stop:1171 length:1062 start_codon:yes stop_codon:yes gene_type:complete
MIEFKKDSVILSTGSNKQYDLPFLWLRDNCQCDECRIIETQEKQFLLHTVPIDISPKSVEVKDESLFVLWPDKHKSVIALDKIEKSGKTRYPEHKLWTSNFTPRSFDWSEFLDNKEIALEALRTFVSFGVIILNNAPKEPNSLELLSKRFGPVYETLFERIHNVSVNRHVYNVAHTSKGLPLHNDFASYKSQPSVQALHMLENECEGGESIIADGWEIVEDLRKDNPEHFNILKKFNVPFREFDENNETYAEAPIIQCSPDGSVESFRFSNQLMQMIDPSREDVKSFYKAYHEVSTRVHDSKYHSTFRLNEGEVLIVASLRVLHARESFIPNGKRHLQDAYFVYDNALNNCVI